MTKLEKAKELIADYLINEFYDHDRLDEPDEQERADFCDFHDLKHINIAYCETEDGKHPFQVCANLVDNSIDLYFDGDGITGKLVQSTAYPSIDDLIINELVWLDYEALVAIGDTYYEKEQEGACTDEDGRCQ